MPLLPWPTSSEGFNDLETVYPEIAKQWHPTKNGSNTPDMFTYGSGESVWWKCSRGHEWQIGINVRNKGNGCPDDTIDDCIYNLKCIMDNIIPFEIGDGRFCLTVIFNHEDAIKCKKLDNLGRVVRDNDGKPQYIYYTFDELVEIIENHKFGT